MTRIAKFITQGELAREKNQNDRALSLLDKAIFEAGKRKDYLSLLSALSHKLLVWKHAFLKSKDQSFLELMFSEAWAGLEIAKKAKVKKNSRLFFFCASAIIGSIKKNSSRPQNLQISRSDS